MRHTKRFGKIETFLKGQPLDRYISVLRCAIGSSSLSEKDRLAGLLRARRFDLLLDWADACSPQLYGSAADYYAVAQIVALIKKYPFDASVVPGLNPEATALKKFRAAEHRCKRVNQRRRALRRNFDNYFQYWEYARSYIERVIGSEPDLAIIYDECDFTAGASLSVHGNKTNVARKILSDGWTVTRTALWHAKRALWSNIHTRECILPGTLKCYDQRLFSDIVNARVAYVDHNKISFVPKTAKTHRSIAVEPLLNGFVQKGTDVYLRTCLKRRGGIDLSDQRVNQVLAYAGSLGGFNPYATIDLSAASDSLSFEVVRDLVPPAWFEFLCEIRSPSYIVGTDAVRHYEKFCSMGNGFCFPLETLIFASVCYAASRAFGEDTTDFSVYGDDIIVRQNIALLVMELLRELGFRTNVDKTFVTGPFRESCGADWYEGQDVRPVSFEEPLVDVRQCFSLHNSFYRSPRCEQFAYQLLPVIRDFVSVKYRYFRPGREPGDTAFSVPLDLFMASPFARRRRDTQNWAWLELVSRARPDSELYRIHSEESIAYARALSVMRGATSRLPFPLRYLTSVKVASVSRPWLDLYDGSHYIPKLNLFGACSVREVKLSVRRNVGLEFNRTID